jgi:hypothetical protein
MRNLGCYYTPEGLVPAPAPEIVYPACGSGAFLERIAAELRAAHPEVELIWIDPPFGIEED